MVSINISRATPTYFLEPKFERWLDEQAEKFNEIDVPNFITHDKMTNVQKRTASELETMASKINDVVGTHTTNASKWSGNLDFYDDSATKQASKLPNCNIAVKFDSTEHHLVHENLHSRSVSWYPQGTYTKNKTWEEIPIEFFAREICQKEGYSYERSSAHKAVDNLIELNKSLELYPTDYEFAKELFEADVTARKNWLIDKVIEKVPDMNTYVSKYKELIDDIKYEYLFE